MLEFTEPSRHYVARLTGSSPRLQLLKGAPREEAFDVVLEATSNMERFVEGLTKERFLEGVEKRYAVLRGA